MYKLRGDVRTSSDKRECRRAFSQKLQATLVTKAGLARTNMYSHAGQILALQDASLIPNTSMEERKNEVTV
jgi:hypothetical protein